MHCFEIFLAYVSRKFWEHAHEDDMHQKYREEYCHRYFTEQTQTKTHDAYEHNKDKSSRESVQETEIDSKAGCYHLWVKSKMLN